MLIVIFSQNNTSENSTNLSAIRRIAVD